MSSLSLRSDHLGRIACVVALAREIQRVQSRGGIVTKEIPPCITCREARRDSHHLMRLVTDELLGCMCMPVVIRFVKDEFRAGLH